MDERKIQAIRADHPTVIDAYPIRQQDIVRHHQYRVVEDVEMDEQVLVVLKPGEALKTSGVATCYAVCATACLPDGRILAGMSHTSMTAKGQDSRQIAGIVVKQLVDAMQAGAPGCAIRLFIAGGQVSKLEKKSPIDGSAIGSTEGTVDEGRCLIEAALPWLVSACLGLSETEDYEQEELDDFWAHSQLELQPSTGRPNAISVYIDDQGDVSYVNRDADFCEVAQPRPGEPSPEFVDPIDDSDDSAEGDGAARTPAVALSPEQAFALREGFREWPDAA